MESSRVIDTELFPYDKFRFRLEFGEKKNITICWFECEEHLQKYIIRSKLDKKSIKIDYRDKPIQLSEEHPRSVEQKSKSKSNRSSGSVRKRKSSLDTPRNTTRTSKHKK